MDIILKAAHVKKEYSNHQITVPVLDDISFEVERGQFLAIMGPSGSGKTTLLNLLSTIDTVTSGNITLNQTEIGKLKNKDMAKFRRENIGFVFQDFNLLDNMSIQDNISLPLALNRMNTDGIEKRVSVFSELLGIKEQLTKYPYQLSGGQKQRAATARALITNPKIIFADEPTGALDTKSSAGLLSCFNMLNEKYDATIIMVTHDANAASYSDKIMFLKDGKIYADINKPTDRRAFYQNILNMLSVMGGAAV